MSEIKLSASWKNQLLNEFQQPYMQQLKKFLQQQKQQGKTIYPAGNMIFNALNSTEFEQVKVVIIGQDPYHGPEQAHGLCFSVNKNVKIPPSLRNIYKELIDDVAIEMPAHGNLQYWADQGVLLLNSVLTVNQGQAGSHQGKGWEIFTDKIIEKLNNNLQNVVYLLWGAYAQKKGVHINSENNLILKSVHPSPLSAHRGFFGCRHFSQCNNYLKQHDKQTIDWQIK
ncbi:MAG TPA: uracil-DNA glycosylase [Oceanospirillales bacterium]|nr:uracil-DNA glycosylase [Oceanospirillales bacterium]